MLLVSVQTKLFKSSVLVEWEVSGPVFRLFNAVLSSGWKSPSFQWTWKAMEATGKWLCHLVVFLSFCLLWFRLVRDTQISFYRVTLMSVSQGKFFVVVSYSLNCFIFKCLLDFDCCTQTQGLNFYSFWIVSWICYVLFFKIFVFIFLLTFFIVTALLSNTTVS